MAELMPSGQVPGRYAAPSIDPRDGGHGRGRNCSPVGAHGHGREAFQITFERVKGGDEGTAFLSQVIAAMGML